MNSDYYLSGRMTSAILVPEGRISAGKIGKALMKTLSVLSKRAEKEKTGWLHDNFYLIYREGRADAAFLKNKSHYPSSDGYPVMMGLCEAYVEMTGGSVTLESVEAFFKGAKKANDPEEKELAAMRAFMGAAIVFALERSDRITAERLIKSIGVLSEDSFGRMAERLSPIEETLLHDSVYQTMSRATRALYRREIEKRARCARMKERELASSLLSLAAKEGKHVGVLLFPRYGKDSPLPIYYGIVNWILASAFSLLIFLAGKPLFALVCWPVVYEVVTWGMQALLSQVNNHPPLFTIDFSDGIPEEEATLAVITTVVKDKRQLDALFERLEEHYLAERGGNNLIFGLLLDIPEAKIRDEKLLAELGKAMGEHCERLKERCGQEFAAFLRQPVYMEKEGKYAGRERKRGALMDLIAMLARKEEDAFHFLSLPRRKTFRHLITLDRDTVPYPGSLTALIEASAHPMNKPVMRGTRVKEGFGILEPECLLSPKSLAGNRFSRLFGGIGGNDVYDPIQKDFYQSAFGRTSFGGKGLMDVLTADKLLTDAFPENLVLSHDTPEGGLMRTGKVSEAVFFEDFPASPLGYYKRMERWTRGDAQNLRLLFSMDALTGYLLVDNIRRALLPLSLLVSLILSMYAGEYLWGGFLLAIIFRPFICEVWSISRYKGEYAPRYLTIHENDWQRAFAASFYRLALLPYEACVTAGGLLRGLYRGLISRRRTLEWSLENEERERTMAKVLLPSVVATLIFPFFAPIWLPSFLFLKKLGKADAKRQFDEEEKAYILRATERGMGFFNQACKREWGYLPADSLQVYPASGLGLRTSPTDIGMFLLAAVSYADLGLPGAGQMLEIASEAVKTAEKLPGKWGHLYNWYDLETMLPAAPKVLSSVDSGNLRASLFVYAEAMRERGRHEDEQRARQMAERMRFDFFYRREKKLLAVMYDDEKDSLSENSYDLYESEARIASFLAIAHGEVPAEHWKKLGRAVKSFRGAAGAASWGGTMFEYLTPYLFMAAPKGTLARESEAFAVMAQKQAGKRKALPWGISESAFYAFDDAIHYRYKAHGVSTLAAAPSRTGEYVIAPYAAFMALESEGSVENLKRIENWGGSGKYGFFEALDATDKDAVRPVELYMPHHIGMQAAAAANALLDGIHRKRFMRVVSHRAMERLLWESPRHFPEAESVSGEAPPATLGNAIGARLIKNPAMKRDEKATYCIGEKNVTLDARGVADEAEKQIRVSLFHDGRNISLLPQKGRRGERYETVFAPERALFLHREEDFISEVRLTAGNPPRFSVTLSNHAPVNQEFRLTAEIGGREWINRNITLQPGETGTEERPIEG